jgi:amidophosphoribosyltransferase
VIGMADGFDGLDDESMLDRPRHECGLIGIVAGAGGDGLQAARLAYFGLFSQQHRGQEGAGLAGCNGATAHVEKGVGLVSNVFSTDRLARLSGSTHVIGHTRYSTTGSHSERNLQPFLVETRHGPLGVAHNGNLMNAAELRADLLHRGYPLAASSDSEVLVLMLAGAMGGSWEERIERTMANWVGAYSLAILAHDRVIGVRDPWGFRPLSVGQLPDGGHALASETCALRTIGCTDVREVEPGEIVTLQGTDVQSRRTFLGAARQARCSFEFIYFSRPDSEWDRRSVHAVRQRLGRELAREATVDADVVIPVPDSSVPAAIGYAREAGLPFNDGFIKNRYIGRTFIEPTTALRRQGVKLKFNALTANLEGRRVVMIDDSIVRGTTAGPLVQLVRDAGATEVHVRITCPPIVNPCYMGIDMGHEGDLVSRTHDEQALAALIGADSVGFLSVGGLRRAIDSTSGYCEACFTGDYPIEVGPLTVGRPSSKSAFEGAIR